MTIGGALGALVLAGAIIIMVINVLKEVRAERAKIDPK